MSTPKHPRFDESLLRQEVEELTALLRDEKILADLRQVLVEHGHDPANVLLAGFIESEDGFEWGVIVTPQKEVYEFERNLGQSKGFSRWNRVTDPSSLLDCYPAVLVGLAQIDS